MKKLLFVCLLTMTGGTLFSWDTWPVDIKNETDGAVKIRYDYLTSGRRWELNNEETISPHGSVKLDIPEANKKCDITFIYPDETTGQVTAYREIEGPYQTIRKTNSFKIFGQKAGEYNWKDY